MTSGGITGLADRLESVSYLKRVPNPLDRRSRLLLLTPAGMEEIRRYLGPFIEEMEQITAELSPEVRELVGQFLERVVVTVDPLQAEYSESSSN
jgi:DNA-binding MarR family transcriptional regulator